MDAQHREAILRQFEQQGVQQVRLLLVSGRIPSEYVYLAAKFVGDFDEEERSRSEASQTSQMEIARSANRAAWIAAKAAIIAAAIAIISIAVSILLWLFPRR